MNQNGIKVEMKDIGSIATSMKHNHINILKIDIEGAEFNVIASFETRLTGVSVDQICLETHERFWWRIIGFLSFII